MQFSTDAAAIFKIISSVTRHALDGTGLRASNEWTQRPWAFGNGITRTSGVNTWRAGCGGSRTSGSEGGSEKPISRKADRALRPDPYTKLAGPHKWTWYHLYVILDVYSRYVVAWLVAPRESARLAEELIADAVYAQGVPAGQLSLHADRGTSMTSKTVSQLLADLGVLQSHSRPHQSNDNPFSEANFKTLKYFPAFPRRFAGLVSARSFVDGFFDHYNHHHRHSGPPKPASVRHRDS